MISLTRKGITAFGAQDEARAAAFATQAAIALENARLYDEITRFNEQLEQIVDARTNELNRAYKSLEQLDKAKSDFIDIAAHELRTPMTSIHGYTHLLLENPKVNSEVETDTLVKAILRGANQLNEIVNSMLDVAKIDTQSLQMSREWIKLNPLFSQLQNEFENAIRERQLILDLRGVISLPAIKADYELLYKVFYHLLMNAIKYTPDEGKISITGSMNPETGVHPEIEIVICDTGIGIAPEDQHLIFEKFYQIGKVAFHSSGRTKFKGGGPGLGLAIARGIVLAHGGKIWVESEGFDEIKCPGSQFHVRLPVTP